MQQLLKDLEQLVPQNFEVLLTLNIPEDESGLVATGYPLRVVRNSQRKGFGANHNAAFQLARGQYFAVVNPDIRVKDLRLDALRNVLDQDRVGACAPLVLNAAGGIEDSARRFPTFKRLLRRVFLDERNSDYPKNEVPFDVDWVAGMFVIFRRESFAQCGGFDDRRFFMYYEDVDLCDRMHRLGWSVRVQPATSVIHHAQRASHRNLRHLRWHAVSAMRYLTGW